MDDVHAGFRAAHAAALQEMAATGLGAVGYRNRGSTFRAPEPSDWPTSFHFRSPAIEILAGDSGRSTTARSSQESGDELDTEPVEIERDTHIYDPKPPDGFGDEPWEPPIQPFHWVASCDNGTTDYPCKELAVSEYDKFYEIGTADLDLDREVLHNAIKAMMSTYAIPGAALAVMSADLRLVYAYGFTNIDAFTARGYPDESPISGSSSHMEAVLPTTRFRIGSVSKSITALAILKLHDVLMKRKGIDLLDELIAHYFPIVRSHIDFPITFPPSESYPQIKVRHLLAHLSGMEAQPYPDGVAQYFWLRDHRTCLPVTNLQGIEYMADTYSSPGTPGAAAIYNNYAFQVLGHLVEVLSDQDYADYVTEHVLQPFGMENTKPGDSVDFHKDEARYYASGYSCLCDCKPQASSSQRCITNSVVEPKDCLNGRQVRAPYGTSDLNFALSSGGWTSTVVDLLLMIKGIRRCIDGTAARSPDGGVLTQRTAMRMWSDQRTNNGDESGFGLGWSVSPFTVHKGGTMCGTSAMVVHRRGARNDNLFSYAFVFNCDIPDSCRSHLRDDSIYKAIENQEDLVNALGAKTDLFD